MSITPDVLVIIPSYGHFDYVKRAVASIEEHRASSQHSVDYVIVDDASEEWEQIEWSTWPSPSCLKLHFPKRAGLTRSWNAGLHIAEKMCARYAVCTNSDVLFSRGWVEPLISALQKGFALVGPVTNAPGHAYWQNVSPFLRQSVHPALDDDRSHIDTIAEAIAALPIEPIEAPLNGFLLMAETMQWQRGRFDTNQVFNPSFPLAHNEQELQQRWWALGYRSAFVPQSYVFHYRSVSRAEGMTPELGTGAFRALPSGQA